jgi:H/ACA ribonucleoprotein complex subunit 2
VAVAPPKAAAQHPCRPHIVTLSATAGSCCPTLGGGEKPRLLPGATYSGVLTGSLFLCRLSEAVPRAQGREMPEGEEPAPPKVSPIASPLAGDKLTKKLLKLVKKSAKEKKVKRGVKEVVKSIRKKSKGICIIAGDISPIDVISHVPVLCEESGISYCYVASKQALGAAGSTKRPTSVVLCLDTDAENAELRNECVSKIQSLPVVGCA